MVAILVLYTGGTIGMTAGPDGLTPAPGLVEEALEGLGLDAVELEVFAPLLDSADVGAKDWNRIIARVRSRAGPVVVVHGTDTMSFTGAALSCALAGRDAPVILCGSMKPLGTGGDGEANLALALKAATSAGPGVWLAFAGRLLAAAGLQKRASDVADAFISVAQAALPPVTTAQFDARRLAIVTLSPGLPADSVAAMLGALDGAVLRVFGAGTMMDDPALRKVLHDATRQGKRLRAVSQCTTGGVAPAAYAAGAGLWAAGVENGGTETPELALMRLWLDLPG